MKAPLATIGGRFFVRAFSFFSIFSLRTADRGKGDSGGPRQVVHSTRTGFGFSFVLHRPFRPSSSVDLKQYKAAVHTQTENKQGILALQVIPHDHAFQFARNMGLTFPIPPAMLDASMPLALSTLDATLAVSPSAQTSATKRLLRPASNSSENGVP
jgi:hypothetical protein